MLRCGVLCGGGVWVGGGVGVGGGGGGQDRPCFCFDLLIDQLRYFLFYFKLKL